MGINRIPATIVQYTQYYPSGLPLASNSGDYPYAQPNKYNGKEFVEMNGYDTYDYGARGYYAAIGRFTTPDPLCEKYYSISPYAYCAGNPMNRIDPDGMDIKFYNYNENGKPKEVEFSQLDVNIQKALVMFAKTKVGFDYLKQFAKEGESFGNKEAGGVINFAEDGKNSNYDYNVMQMKLENNPNYNGDANVRMGKNTLQFDVRLNTKRFDNNPENIAITFAHESFIHLDPNDRISKFVNLYKIKDIKGFNDFRNNTILRLDEGVRDHSEYINKGNNSFNRLNLLTKQNSILIKAYNSHNKNYNYLKK